MKKLILLQSFNIYALINLGELTMNVLIGKVKLPEKIETEDFRLGFNVGLRKGIIPGDASEEFITGYQAGEKQVEDEWFG